MSEPFIAEIRIFAGNFAPRGWAFCNGQLVPTSQNTALFSLIGNIYGGDGSTTTALPNLEGRAPMHPGRGPGLTARQLGQRGGAENVTLNVTQMPKHEHTVYASSSPATTDTPSTDVHLSSSGFDSLYQSNTTNSVVEMNSSTLSSPGGGQPHLNMQPYLVLNFIIAMIGLYPTRS